MVRNWAIIRGILLKLEESSQPNAVVNAENFYGFSKQEVAYNMRLLKEAGYIEANILESSEGDGLIHAALARRLTNLGHDLIDTIRHDSVWEKIRSRFENKGIDMTFDLVVKVGKQIMERMLLS